MKLPRIPILSLSLALTLLVACANDEHGTGSGDQLEGVDWVLDAPSMTALVPDAPGDARVTILFQDGDVGGSAACNTYGGTYEAGADGGDLSVEVGQMTEMACDESLMELESAYIDALGQVTTWARSGEDLVLTGGPTTLTFNEEQQPESLPLVGTTWTLTTIALPGSDAVGSVIAGTDVTLVLADDGTFSGSGGCNQMNGTYALDGDTITLSSISSTMMTCGADVDEQEQAYTASLEAASSFEIAGNQLTLQDVDGVDLLVFDGS